MKKNITIELVNWYINAREAKGGANYLLNNANQGLNRVY